MDGRTNGLGHQWTKPFIELFFLLIKMKCLFQMGWEIVLCGIAAYYLTLCLVGFIVYGLNLWTQFMELSYEPNLTIPMAFGFANMVGATDCIILKPIFSGGGASKLIGEHTLTII